MGWLESILEEILGLFVDDDGSFALAIVAWLAFIVFVLAPVTADAGWLAPALFSGLALILIESVLRFARSYADGGRRLRREGKSESFPNGG